MAGPLRTPGGARGVEDQRQFLGVAVVVFRDGLGFGQERGQGNKPCFRFPVRHGKRHVRRRRYRGFQLVEQLGACHREAGARILQPVGEIVGAELHVGRNRHRADDVHGQENVDQVGRVGDPHDDPVAGRDAKRAERRRVAVHRRAERTIGNRLVAVVVGNPPAPTGVYGAFEQHFRHVHALGVVEPGQVEAGDPGARRPGRARCTCSCAGDQARPSVSINWPYPGTGSWISSFLRLCQTIAWLLVTTGLPRSRSSGSIASAARIAVQEMK